MFKMEILLSIALFLAIKSAQFVSISYERAQNNIEDILNICSGIFPYIVLGIGFYLFGLSYFIVSIIISIIILIISPVRSGIHISGIARGNLKHIFTLVSLILSIIVCFN
jgi:hypothetical protein